MNINVPIYRAKKIDSDEYAIGYYFNAEIENQHIIMKQVVNKDDDFMYDNDEDEIDPLTLSIHFPDMLANDSDRLLANGDKDLRIFASLSVDGRGGDLISENKSTGIVLLENGRSIINWIKDKDFFSRDLCNHHKKSKITGIKQ